MKLIVNSPKLVTLPGFPRIHSNDFSRSVIIRPVNLVESLSIKLLGSPSSLICNNGVGWRENEDFQMMKHNQDFSKRLSSKVLCAVNMKVQCAIHLRAIIKSVQIRIFSRTQFRQTYLYHVTLFTSQLFTYLSAEF